MQLLLSLYMNSAAVMSVITFILVLASYYGNRFLVHGYAMACRYYSDSLYPQDEVLTTAFGIPYLICLIVGLVGCGYGIIRKRNIIWWKNFIFAWILTYGHEQTEDSFCQLTAMYYWRGEGYFLSEIERAIYLQYKICDNEQSLMKAYSLFHLMIYVRCICCLLLQLMYCFFLLICWWCLYMESLYKSGRFDSNSNHRYVVAGMHPYRGWELPV